MLSVGTKNKMLSKKGEALPAGFQWGGEVGSRLQRERETDQKNINQKIIKPFQIIIVLRIKQESIEIRNDEGNREGLVLGIRLHLDLRSLLQSWGRNGEGGRSIKQEE